MSGMLRARNIGALLLMAFLLLPSCAPQAKKRSDIDLLMREADQYANSDNYKKALDSYKKAYKKYPDDVTLREGYIATLENIVKTADDTYEKGYYVLSGRHYSLLVKNIPWADRLSGELSFKKVYLKERIEDCRSSLSLSALSSYRSGNIETAISIWKNILSFAPDDQSARKALDTATIQLKNLKQRK